MDPEVSMDMVSQSAKYVDRLVMFPSSAKPRPSRTEISCIITAEPLTPKPPTPTTMPVTVSKLH